MKTVFSVSNRGQDGTDGSFICAVLDEELAKRVAHNQGAMGQGSGDIEEIKAYESFDELPEKIKNRILKDENSELSKKEKLLEKLKANFSEEEISLLKNL